MVAVFASVWLGAMGLFVATVSPTVFQVLDGQQASRFLRAYFPRLFRFELAFGLTIAVVGWPEWTALGAGALMAVLACVNLVALTPRINAAADRLANNPTDAHHKRRFARLHGVSAALFAINGLICLGLVIQTLWSA